MANSKPCWPIGQLFAPPAPPGTSLLQSYGAGQVHVASDSGRVSALPLGRPDVPGCWPLRGTRSARPSPRSPPRAAPDDTPGAGVRCWTDEPRPTRSTAPRLVHDTSGSRPHARNAARCEGYGSLRTTEGAPGAILRCRAGGPTAPRGSTRALRATRCYVRELDSSELELEVEQLHAAGELLLQHDNEVREQLDQLGRLAVAQPQVAVADLRSYDVKSHARLTKTKGADRLGRHPSR